MSTLEQSLDDIVSSNSSRRRERPGRGGPRRARGSRGGRQPFRGTPRNNIPAQIFESAAGRALLRLRNVHPDLNGMDLSDLFSNVAPVDFVKFDPRDESIAYICFQEHQHENIARAINRFDGKKAMGEILVVESATSLADRIAPSNSTREFVKPNPRGRESRGRESRGRESRGRESRGREIREDPRPKEAHRVRTKARQAKQAKERKPKPQRKTAEDLDAELSAYMSGATQSASEESQPAFAAQNNGESMVE